jgi:hypothetical protein
MPCPAPAGASRVAPRFGKCCNAPAAAPPRIVLPVSSEGRTADDFTGSKERRAKCRERAGRGKGVNAGLSFWDGAPKAGDAIGGSKTGRAGGSVGHDLTFGLLLGQAKSDKLAQRRLSVTKLCLVKL